MPAPISFQSGVNRSGPLPQPARNPNLTKFGAASQAAPRDTVRFGNGAEKTCPHTDCPHEVNETPEVDKPEVKEDGAFKKRLRVTGHAFTDMFHGGKWFDWKPFHGWKSDIVQATVVTLPLTILPGSQLIFIPMWLAGGAVARGLWTLGKGMINPDKVLKPKDDKAAEESTPTT